MAAPSFDRPLSRRSALELEKRIDTTSLKVSAMFGNGDARGHSPDTASIKTDEKTIGAFSASSWKASSKSSDEISSSASATDAKTSTKLAHSVSFSLKTNFRIKEEFDADNLAEQSYKRSSLSNQEDPPIDSLPPPSLSSVGHVESGRRENLGSGGGSVVARSPSVTVANFIHCKLCLCDYPPREMVQLSSCRCLFCADCVSTYITTTINDGDVLKITCPDGECPADFKEIDSNQIRQILGDDVIFANYVRFRTLREIENDPNGTWCPSVGCETICHVCRVDDAGASVKASPPQPVTCPTCSLVFCSVCKSKWHPDGECHNPFVILSSSSTNFAGKTRSQRSGSLLTSKSNNNPTRSGSTGGNFFQNFLRRGPAAMEAPGADGALDSSPIKRCPICHILIEREEGCAQMMCKRCKHVFCWYCLESLDNDFLLRHYDRGPCKNKLGHSRASVIWHRTQVVGIFAGFGMLLLMASPFLLLAAPCILCCKCSCCHCLDIDDVEWYEGKGSPGTREARQKRLAKSFGAASTSGLDDENDDFEDVPSFHSWDRKQEEKAAKSREKIKTEILTMTTTTNTTARLSVETSNEEEETQAETQVKPLYG